MDKKLNRVILFQKKAFDNTPKEKQKEGNQIPPDLNKEYTRKTVPNIDLMINWINSHPFFKWSAMCKEIGIDKGNFQRILKSKSSPKISQEKVDKILIIIKKYGYAE